MYLDKLAAEPHFIFLNKKNARRLFAVCMLIASKLHKNELSLDNLQCMFLNDVSPDECLSMETSLTQCLTREELIVQPKDVLRYINPLLSK